MARSASARVRRQLARHCPPCGAHAVRRRCRGRAPGQGVAFLVDIPAGPRRKTLPPLSSFRTPGARAARGASSPYRAHSGALDPPEGPCGVGSGHRAGMIQSARVAVDILSECGGPAARQPAVSPPSTGPVWGTMPRPCSFRRRSDPEGADQLRQRGRRAPHGGQRRDAITRARAPIPTDPPYVVLPENGYTSPEYQGGCLPQTIPGAAHGPLEAFDEQRAARVGADGQHHNPSRPIPVATGTGCSRRQDAGAKPLLPPGARSVAAIGTQRPARVAFPCLLAAPSRNADTAYDSSTTSHRAGGGPRTSRPARTPPADRAVSRGLLPDYGFGSLIPAVARACCRRARIPPPPPRRSGSAPRSSMWWTGADEAASPSTPSSGTPRASRRRAPPERTDFEWKPPPPRPWRSAWLERAARPPERRHRLGPQGAAASQAFAWDRIARSPPPSPAARRSPMVRGAPDPHPHPLMDAVLESASLAPSPRSPRSLGYRPRRGLRRRRLLRDAVLDRAGPRLRRSSSTGRPLPTPPGQQRPSMPRPRWPRPRLLPRPGAARSPTPSRSGLDSFAPWPRACGEP